MIRYKTIGQIILCISLCIGFASCNMFSDKSQQDSDNIITNPSQQSVDSIKSSPSDGIKAALDSVNGLKEVVTKLSSNVSAINVKLNQTSDSIKDLNESVETQKNKGMWFIIFGGGLGIIGFIIAIVSLIKISSLKHEICDLQKSRTRQRNDITHLQNDNLRTTNNQRTGYTNSQQVSYREFSELASRVKTLEQKAYPQNQSFIERSVQQPRKNTVTKKEKNVEGYFGSAVEGGEGRGYFKRLLESRDGARFKVSVEGNNAEFIPIIQVGELISSDAMDLAVEYDGNVNKSDSPRNMKVKQSGRAVKDGDKWTIINKAIVILIK